MKRYLTAWYGVAGSITEHKDGSATLVIRQSGKILYNKKHANIKAAMSAWYRANA